MAFNEREVPPKFLSYSFNPDNQDGALSYLLGTDESAESIENGDRFSKFRINAQGKDPNSSNNVSVDINIEDLHRIASAAETDIELKLRSLKVCVGGTEKNIVVLCSQAFSNPD